MFRPEAIRIPRSQLTSSIFRELSSPDPILLTGPSGSGKSRTLIELSELLAEQSARHTLIDFTGEGALEQLKNVEPGGVVLVDGLEHVDLDLLALFAETSVSSNTVWAVENEEATLSTGASLQQFVADHPEYIASIASTRHINIAPLTRLEAEQIVNEMRPAIDSVTAAAVLDMAWGRPGWLLDILQIAEAGKVAATPYPTFSALSASDYLLPVIHSAAFSNGAQLTPNTIAAAVTLSNLGPRTDEDLALFVGEETVEALREAELLLEVPHASGLFGVPEIFGAALRPRADLALTREHELRISLQLLELESFGIPLTERESHFCAYARHSQDAGESSAIEASEAVLHAHARLVEEVASVHIAFSRPGAKDLILRSRRLGELGELPRLRAVASLRGPIDALRTLSTRPITIGEDRTPTARDYGVEFLREMFLAELGSPRAFARAPETFEHDPIAQASLVFRRWNDNEPLGSDAALILDVAQRHPSPVIALIAEQLLTYENARRGRTMRRIDGSSHERTDLVADLALSGEDGYSDILTTSTVLECIIGLFSATNMSGSETILRIADRLPGTAFHSLWIRHLFTAMTALATGHLDLAAREWHHFERRLPRFIPLRIRAVVTALGVTFRGERPEPTPGFEIPFQLLAYFNGKTEHTSFRAPNLDDEVARATVTTPLQVVGIATEHIEAVAAQNPAALLKVSKKLFERRHWVPSLYALREARAIFLRRRATGSVSQCDDQIAELKRIAREEVPWISLSDTKMPPKIGLTPRQLEAAYLASTGLRNRDIAERLNCSARTVESHLAAARAKLGVSSREELKQRLEELKSS